MVRSNSSRGSRSTPAVQYGVIYPSNGAAGSNMRIVFSGAVLPNRKSKSVIWSVKWTQQNGYYGFAWDSEGDATWHLGAYENGCHPYPCDGTYNTTGQALVSTGSNGTVQYYEIAGRGDAGDYISSSNTFTQASYLKSAAVWVTQGFTDQIITVSTANDTIERRYYVELADTSKVIIQRQANPLTRTPAAPIFALGASEWTATGDTNVEASSGTFRNLKIFNNATLSAADMASEGANVANNAVTSAGIAALYYANVNPTPSDIADKSGNGNNPAWANASHGTLYTG